MQYAMRLRSVIAQWSHFEAVALGVRLPSEAFYDAQSVRCSLALGDEHIVFVLRRLWPALRLPQMQRHLQWTLCPIIV